MVLGILMRTLMPVRAAGLPSTSMALANRMFDFQSAYDNHVNQNLVNYMQNRGAARRGKRLERTRLARINANKRRLLEAQNPKPKKNLKKHIKVDKTLYRFVEEHNMDETLPPPPEDDVYFYKKFRRPRYSLDEIIEFHRQMCHPDVLNHPDAFISASIQLNLKMKLKKKKYIENIASTVCYPHTFQYTLRPRKIIALCKDEADQAAAKEAGAIIAGATDVALLLKSNQLTQRDFDHIVCHTDFLDEFSAIKGMKGQPYFPTKQRANFGNDIAKLVKYFKDGVDYTLRKVEDEQAIGFIDCYFGKLDMTNEQLRDNILTLFKSVDRFKPNNLADDKQFYQRVSITVPHSDEVFQLKFWELNDDYEDPYASEDEEEDTEQSGIASKN